MHAPSTSTRRDEEVLQHIRQSNAHLNQAQRAAKYAKMSLSSYNFFRGTNFLFWTDFFRDWHVLLFGGLPETRTWIQGDAHLYNFGAFGNENHQLVYGMDDFDDGIIADYQYDLWRLCISLVLDCKKNQRFGRKKQKKALKALGKSYLKTMGASENSKSGPSDFQVITPENAGKPLRQFLQRLEEKRSRGELLEKWTIVEAGSRRFQLDKDNLQGLSDTEKNELKEALEKHFYTINRKEAPDISQPGLHFRIKDAARRLNAGTGSLGARRYYVIIEAEKDSHRDDVILDIKEQIAPEATRQMSPSELAEYKAQFPDEGMRHSRAFLALSGRTDPYLGWLHYEDRHFSIRERSPFKEDFPTEDCNKFKEYRSMARIWGQILARAHLQGAREIHPARPSNMAAHLKLIRKQRKKQFLHLLVETAFQYADCVERDYQAFMAHVNLLLEDLK